VGWGVGSDEFGAGIKEEFFESSQGIGAVRRSEAETKMLTLDSLSTLREPFLSTVGHNALLRCCHPVCSEKERGTLQIGRTSYLPSC